MYSNTKRSSIAAMAILLVIACAGPVSAATSFTYQGRLEQSGVPVDAVVDFQLALFDGAMGGTQIGTTQTIPNLQVTGGVFTIAVDFGASAFDGSPRWLEIAVANPAGSAYATLSPRQEVTAAPYSTHSLKPWQSAPGKTWYRGGDVGIGLASPATPLALLVNGGTRPVGLTQNQIGSDTLEMTSTDGANQQATRLAFRGGTNNARVEFYRGARGSESEIMRINPAGDVGVGSADPLDSLGYSGSWKGLHVAAPAASPLAIMCIDGLNSARLHLRNDAGATDGKDFAITNNGNRTDFRWLDESFNNRAMLLSFDDQGKVAMGSTPGASKFTLSNSSAPSALSIESDTQGIDIWGAGTAVDATANEAGSVAVFGAAPLGCGVRGVCSSLTGWAGQFDGRVYFRNLQIGVLSQWTNQLEVGGFLVSKSTPGDWLQNSDARIKTNVRTISDALDTLDLVRMVDYAYTDSYRSAHPELPNRRYLGVIAQEFARVFPDYVRAGSGTLPSGERILQVDTYPLEVYTAAAVQELGKEVTRREQENRRSREKLTGLVEGLRRFQESRAATR